MVLRSLQDYLRGQGTASLAQMESSLGVQAEALKGMLALLQRKGRVQLLPRPERCHGCVQCQDSSLEFYRWCGDDGPAAV